MNVQRLFHPADQHVALAAKALGLLHGKARFLQASADKACRGEGGKRCARAGQSRHRAKQMLAPHVRILGGGEAVKEPRVHRLIHRIIERIGQLIDVAKPQVKGYAPAIQNQTMAAADVGRPLRLKLLCPGRKLRPALVGKPQIVRGKREFFETDEM